MGYAKLTISFLKYTPAAYWNWKRKSTKGWSIFNIILDLVGATFSIASGGLSTSNGLNITKMILALFCFVIAFLIAFIIVKKEEDNEKN
jgi:cystinosin